MTKEKLIKRLEEKLVILKEKPDSKIYDEIEFLNNFIKNNKLNSIEDLSEIDVKQFFIANILAKTDKFSLEKIIKVANDIEINILNKTRDEIDEYIMLIEEILEEEIGKEIVKALSEKNKVEKRKLLKRMIKPSKLLDNLLLDFIVNIDSSTTRTLKILEIAYEEEELVTSTLILIGTFADIKETLDEYYQSKEEFEAETGHHIRNRHIKEMKSDILKTRYNCENIFNELRIIKNYLADISKQQETKDKITRKQIGLIEGLIKTLSLLPEKTEIKTYKQLIHKISDEHIRLEVLKYVYENNIEVYKELEEEFISLSKNSITKYHALLQSQGLSEEEYDIEKIMKNSYDELEKIIKLLGKNKITDQEILIEILETTNLKRVEEIIELNDKNIITNSFMNTNSKLFDIENESYKIFISNLDLLNEKKLNPYAFSNSLELLLENSSELRKTIEDIEDYGLLHKITTTYNKEYLKNKNIVKLLDTIIELGYEEYLNDDISILNYDFTKWKRLIILKILNIPVETKEELIEVLESDSFLVTDDKLDDYISSYNLYIPENLKLSEKTTKNLLNDLNQYNNDNLKSIMINDVILSKNRIKRNLEESKEEITVEQLMNAILKDSIMTDEDYEKISTEVYKKLTK